MKLITLIGCLVAISFVASANAAPIFQITEVYAGISGDDGTPDWIEVTNLGDMNGDTGILYYDDESLSAAAGVQLPSFDLSVGESAVFIVTGDASSDSITDFTTIWGAITNLGFATGGGGLKQSGDTAAILLSDDTVIDSLTFGFSGTATLEDPTGMGTGSLSMVGVNGAYESNAFFNDTLGLPGDVATLIGSPGTIVGVPEPASLLMALAAVGTLVFRCRV